MPEDPPLFPLQDAHVWTNVLETKDPVMDKLPLRFQIFLNQDVFIGVGKETNEYFFVYLLLWFYLHLIDYTGICIINVASVISFQYFMTTYHCLL